MNLFRYHFFGGWQRVFYIIASYFKGIWLQLSRGILLLAWIFVAFVIGGFVLGFTQSDYAGLIAGVIGFTLTPALANSLYEKYKSWKQNG